MIPQVIEVPSPLGLRPTGLEDAPEALRRAGLHQRLGSPDAVRIDVPVGAEYYVTSCDLGVFVDKAGRVQPCRFDLLPPCTPITARQRTRRPDRASRAARTGPLPGDQATVPPQDGTRRDQPVR